MALAELLIGVIVAFLLILVVVRSVRIMPQARARNVERLGRYRKTLQPGMKSSSRSSTGSRRRSTCGSRWFPSRARR